MFNYTPYAYQEPFWRYMLNGGKRAYLVWHRRAGKDKTSWNWLIHAALYERPGVYYYFAPTYAQGKKIIWDGIDGDGMPFLAHIPDDCLIAKNETELQIQVTHRGAKGGHSVIQIIGTDRLDSVRGPNPVGCIYSEFAYGNPRAWDIIEPALLENGGWAVFVTTPNGDNHARKLWDGARTLPHWFTSFLTIPDTKRPDGTPVIAESHMDELRARGADEEVIQREYYCSWVGGILGAYFARQLDLLDREGHITRVPWETTLGVQVAWDLGIGDATALWFYQQVAREIRFIDYYEESGEGLPFYRKLLQDKPYAYDAFLMPHDIEVREFTSGKSRRESAEAMGIRPIRVAQRLDKEDQIDAARRILPRCYFDAEKCRQGLVALRNYRKEWDEKRQCFKRQPYHDWTSNGADAFQVFATAYRDRHVGPRNTHTLTDFDVWGYEKVQRQQYTREFEVLT